MKRHFFWILEAFIWLIVLALLAGGIIFFQYDKKQKQHLYQIFLPDVDGIIIGSPVKFMGIQVGYVKELNIIEDVVLLKFLITEENFKLPTNTIATVEFYGLGGSKSLELYPPKEGEVDKNAVIIAQPPKKIGDSLHLLYKMFDDISEITYTASTFMAKLGFIEKDINFVKDSGEDLKNRANIIFNKDKEEIIEEIEAEIK